MFLLLLALALLCSDPFSRRRVARHALDEDLVKIGLLGCGGFAKPAVGEGNRIRRDLTTRGHRADT